MAADQGAMEDEISFQGDERGTPPKRRYSLDLAMQGDGPQAMADALYDIATDLLHGSFPGHRISGGYDVAYRAELVENDPTMTHERYVEELEAYLSGSSEVSEEAHTVDVGHVHVLAEPGGSCTPSCPHPDHRTKETTDGR